MAAAKSTSGVNVPPRAHTLKTACKLYADRRQDRSELQVHRSASTRVIRALRLSLRGNRWCSERGGGWCVPPLPCDRRPVKARTAHPRKHRAKEISLESRPERVHLKRAAGPIPGIEPRSISFISRPLSEWTRFESRRRHTMATNIVKWWKTRFLNGYKQFTGELKLLWSARTACLFLICFPRRAGYLFSITPTHGRTRFICRNWTPVIYFAISFAFLGRARGADTASVLISTV
jgi:hypothetical protein